MILAKDIMTEEIVVIYDDMLLRHVAHLMLRDRVSVFPVIRKEAGLAGIVTITDLFTIINRSLNDHHFTEFHEKIDHFKDVKVGDIMTKTVISIRPDTTIDEITHMMVEKGIHAFPVVDNGKMVGIISRHDILNAVFSYE